MRSSYIALAVPFFFVLISLEILAARARRRSVYRLADAIGDVGCGMAQQVSLLFLAASVIGGYVFVYEHLRVVTWSSPVVAWAVAFVGVDFFYYWWHRGSHGVNALWAAHVVHHQSEDYNLAVALRQSVLTGFTTLPFYLPLAVLGVPPIVFASVNAISTLYQFWIHTELIGKLGVLEEFLNTPSHHRVHHAVNPRYLDKNHGAIFIVWDRLFGTFAREDEAPVYGVVKQFPSVNPIWAQIEPWVALAKKSAEAPRAIDKLRVWIASPAWTPVTMGLRAAPNPYEGSDLARAKYDPEAPRGVQIYVVVQFGLAVLGTAALMFLQETLPRPLLAASAALVTLTLATLAGLLETRRWAKPVEGIRLVLVAAFAIGLPKLLGA